MNRFKKGFTLIEILIVISIIGLLSSLLIPNISSVQRKAKEVGTKAALHTFQIALESYNIDNFHYIKGNNISAYELATILIKEQYLKKTPIIPYSGESYNLDDTQGKIIYSYNTEDNEYSLTAYKRDGKSILTILNNL